MDAVRDSMGVIIQTTNPCEHYTTNPFAFLGGMQFGLDLCTMQSSRRVLRIDGGGVNSELTGIYY